MNISDHYRTLIKRSSEALDEMIKDQKALAEFTKTHNTIKDLEVLHEAVQTRSEARVLQLALREYQFALYAAAASKYRHAHISLRLFLELALASIYFSAYEIKLRKWLNNSCDINWSSITSSDDGVFSKTFVSAFNPDLAEYGKQYLTMAEKVYRECSEFVHGNPQTHSNANQQLGYNQSILLAWAERAEAVRLSFLFAFSCRYLLFISIDRRNNLESLIMDSFGYLPAIQDLYGSRTR